MDKQYARRIRVTVIAAVTASSLEEAQAKLDNLEVSRAVRPAAEPVAGVALQWHGTRSDPVAEGTVEQALRKAWVDDMCEMAREVDGEIDLNTDDNDQPLQ
jgi:hypothetical protein